MTTSLRDFVASELGKLPGSRVLTLHVLVSPPQREKEIFPYAQTSRNHKVLSQNILLLVSETIPLDTADLSSLANPSRILTSALEATLYLFPGTSSSILYIGKIDTTGFSKVAPSPARTLARATIDYYTRADTRPSECGQQVWVHLFARAQSQYLFPDSAEWKAKRVLGDAGLVRWWWSLLSDVARDVESAKSEQRESCFKGTKLWYILPGFTELEAYHTLSSGSSLKLSQSSELPWAYGHPYDDSSISFPLLGKSLDPTPASENPTVVPESSSKVVSIASLIPTFPDDPKARFLGEIASTTSEKDMPPPMPKPTSPVGSTRSHNVSSSNNSSSPPSHTVDSSPTHSPVKKRRRVDEGIHAVFVGDEVAGKSTNKPGNDGNEVPAGVATPEPTEPVATSLPESNSTQPNPSTPPHSNASGPHKSGTHAETELVRRGRQALAAVSAQEFWERMGFRQECALGAITAFFVAVFECHDTLPKLSDINPPNDCISLPTHTRITQSLMNHAFSTPEKAIRSTQMLETSIRTLCDGSSSLSEDQAEGSKETSSFYQTHIYKAITLNNPPLLPQEATPARPTTVNVLQVKRKVRR